MTLTYFSSDPNGGQENRQFRQKLFCGCKVGIPGHMTKMAVIPICGKKKPTTLSSDCTYWLSGKRSLPLGYLSDNGTIFCQVSTITPPPFGAMRKRWAACASRQRSEPAQK